jgi:hypothetical protein
MSLGAKLFLTVLLGAAAAAAPIPAYSTETDEPARRTIKWPRGTIRVALSSSLREPGPNIKFGSDVAAALERSLAKWQAAANITFEVVDTSKASVSPAGATGDGINLITIASTGENLLLFERGRNDSPAATRIFYDRSGRITEADVVLSPLQQFSADGAFGTYDLEAVFTHEIGHLLGFDHSPIVGSAMYEHQARNGVFGMHIPPSHSLSAADESAARAAYGAPADDLECCGVIEGRLLAKGQTNAVGGTVWLESTSSGNVEGAVPVDSYGRFSLGGLRNGEYNVIWSAGGGEDPAISQKVGTIEAEAGDIRELSARILDTGTGIDLQYLGVNGHLLRMPLTLSAGRTYTIYAGGLGIDGPDVNIGFGSQDLAVHATSRLVHDYGKNISVISVAVTVASDAAPGTYSVWAEDANGIRTYLPGSVIVTRQ